MSNTETPLLTFPREKPSSPASPDNSSKKPRRSQRIKGAPVDIDEETVTTTESTKDLTVSPHKEDPADVTRTPASSPPPQDNTQVASQFYYPPLAEEGLDKQDDDNSVWGYLWPLGGKSSEVIKLNKQAPTPATPEKKRKKGTTPKSKKKQLPPSGFIVGRHAECDLLIDEPVISNRHCVIFKVFIPCWSLNNIEGLKTYVGI